MSKIGHCFEDGKGGGRRVGETDHVLFVLKSTPLWSLLIYTSLTALLGVGVGDAGNDHLCFVG